MAARAVGRIPAVLGDLDPDPKEAGDGASNALDPSVLASEPDRFYSTLEQLLAAGSFGPEPNPSSISPASRLIDTCRNLEK